MARITNWKSLETYDHDLLEQVEIIINNSEKKKHYQLHPELLPYIGKNYKHGKILLVGESHYINNENNKEKQNIVKYDKTLWYSCHAIDCFENKEKAAKEDIYWFTTRHVVLNFMNNICYKAYSMFRNPAKEISENFFKDNLSHSEAFSLCAFYNYFQRPSENKGESFVENGKNDSEIAFSVFSQLIEILAPTTVIFLSKKAYDSYYAQSCKHKFPDINIAYVSHPTCAHWYDDKKDDTAKTGKNKFVNLLKKYTPQLDTIALNLRQTITYTNDIEKELLTLINKIKNVTGLEFKIRNRRTKNPTIKIIKTDNFLSEIKLYFSINTWKYSIGYQVEYENIWIAKEDITKHDNENEDAIRYIYDLDTIENYEIRKKIQFILEHLKQLIKSIPTV